MKKNKIILLVLSIFSILLISLNIKTVNASDIEYYVTYSTDNYKKKSKNLMTLDNDHYVLENQELDSTKLFRIESNTGAIYYNKSGNSMNVSVSTASKYNIYFSTNYVYDTEHTTDTKLEKTDCHISYEYYLKDSYTLTINDTSNYSLTFNQYNSTYDEYYIDELYLEKDSILKFYDSKNNQVNYSDSSETYTISSSGYYNIKYMTTKIDDDKTYKFDESGSYGSGDDYTYNGNVVEANIYYVSLKDSYINQYTTSKEVDGNTLYKLEYTRDNSSKYYSSKDLFISSRDTNVYYNIYYYDQVLDSYTLLDDDNDSDTVVSKIKVSDLGWYNFKFIELTDNKYTTTIEKVSRPINEYYLASNTNNYLYDEYGNYELDDEYKFVKVESDDNLYNEDYEQYKLTISFDKYQVKNNVEFYITDGTNYYKDSTDYIVISKEGTYEILFSKDHVYSRTRHYKYSLKEENKDITYVTIENVSDFINFVDNCNNDSTYSINKVFNLTCDLDLSKYSNLSIKAFNGVFNGNYHTIKNYTYSSDDTNTYASLFNLITKEGNVNCLNVENVAILAKNASYVGVIGKTYGTVENLKVSGSISGKSYVGVIGYVGNYKLSSDESSTDSTVTYGYSYITNVKNNAYISGKAYVGGIAGYNGGKIISSINNQYINNKSYSSNDNIRCVGGIAGYSVGEIINSTNNGLVGYEKIGSFIGGIAGLSNGAFYFNTNNAIVNGRSNVGGIVGYYTTITKDSNYSTYFGSTEYDDIINQLINIDSSSDSEVVESTNLGKNIILYCLNLYEIKSSTTNAGGIVGLIDIKCDIKGCINKACVEVSTGSYAGGIAGNVSNASIVESISYGNIKVAGLNKATYAAGIAGSITSGSIKYCESYSVVEGTSYIGGIAGYASSTSYIISNISDSYLVLETSSSYTGSILGYAEGVESSDNSFGDYIKYNYYITNSFSGIDSKNYGSESNYAAYNIDSNNLVSYNNLSMYLDNLFPSTYYIGGDSIDSYPYLIIFEELFEADNFDNTLDYDSLSKDILSTLFKIEQSIARQSNIVVYMEWNYDNGDDLTDLDNYEINTIIRYYSNEEVSQDIKFKYASLNNDIYYYSTKKNNYIVSWGSEDNHFIYAKYNVVSTSLNTDDLYIFVEGTFDSNTKVELERFGENYKLKFTLNGAEVVYDNITVKIKNTSDKIYTCNYDLLEEVSSSTYGEYQSFKLSKSNQEFTLKSVDNTNQIMMYVIISILGVILVVNVVAIISFKKSKKNKKIEQNNA